MNSEWRFVKFEEVGLDGRDGFAMGPFGSRIKSSNFVPTGVPVIRGNNLLGNRFHDDDYVFLTPEKAEELRSAKARPGDLVFTHRGTLGQVAMVPRAARFPEYVVSQSQMKVSVDPGRVLPEFVEAFFQSSVGQSRLLANTTQTGVPALARPLSTLREIEIPLPPLSEQRRIVGVLGSLLEAEAIARAESRTLAAMREMLLPKLVSGRIRVPESYDPDGTKGPVVELDAAG
jgi:type I restriction enzyme S subunit